MNRAYKYRLYPNKLQAAVLSNWIELTRELYNAALQERVGAWKKQHKSLNYYTQAHELAAVKEARPEFKEIPIIILRGTLQRLNEAFKGFFRRCQSGEDDEIAGRNSEDSRGFV